MRERPEGSPFGTPVSRSCANRQAAWIGTIQIHAKGTKLNVVRQALGHESLATTSVYVGLAREVMDQELQRNAL